MRTTSGELHAVVGAVGEAFFQSDRPGKQEPATIQRTIKKCDRSSTLGEIDELTAELKRADSGKALSVTGSSSSLASKDCDTAENECQSLIGRLTQWWKAPARLYSFQEIPVHLQDNRFIMTGYRAFYSRADCLRSIFRWHNESVNIWSHWTGAVIFAVSVAAALRWQEAIDVGNGVAHLSSQTDRFIMALYLTSAVICLFCSGLFHTFYCHAHIRVYDNMAITDYTGISLLITGSFTALIYFAFRPRPDILPIPLAIIGITGLAGVILPWFPFFRSHKYRILRTIIFFGITGTITSTFLWAITQIWDEIIHQWQWSWVIWLSGDLLSYVGGALIYATRFPECLMPGKFDIIGASHQLWHLLVITGAISHWRLLVELRDWRLLQEVAAHLS